jgi:hypothetical protein
VKRIEEADHIVFTSGRIPELIFIPAPVEANRKRDPERPPAYTGAWEAYAADTNSRPITMKSALMSQGDVLTDFSAAIKAIAAGSPRRRIDPAIAVCNGHGFAGPCGDPDTPVS